MQRTAGRRAAAAIISRCCCLCGVAIFPEPCLGLLRTSSCGRLGARLLLLPNGRDGLWGGGHSSGADVARCGVAMLGGGFLMLCSHSIAGRRARPCDARICCETLVLHRCVIANGELDPAALETGSASSSFWDRGFNANGAGTGHA